VCRTYYDPVNLDEDLLLLQDGLDPTESAPGVRHAEAIGVGAGACKVRKWAQDEASPETSRKKWKEVMEALGDEAADPTPTCPGGSEH
jgi:hypothetical protein